MTEAQIDFILDMATASDVSTEELTWQFPDVNWAAAEMARAVKAETRVMAAHPKAKAISAADQAKKAVEEAYTSTYSYKSSFIMLGDSSTVTMYKGLLEPQQGTIGGITRSTTPMLSSKVPGKIKG